MTPGHGDAPASAPGWGQEPDEERGEQGPDGDGPRGESGFTVRLANFEGPFDLLLQLIGQHRLDVTEVALHHVTDEFIAYTARLGAEAGLDSITEFLVVASTLLDLKTARLLPSGEVEDEEDLELLEARDLLFARVLQYRAYKRVAELFAELESAALQRYPAAVGLEEKFVGLLPDVQIGVSADRLAEVAAFAMLPKEAPSVRTDHLHIARVSVAEHADRIVEILRCADGDLAVPFSLLVAECESQLEIVARFLGLLELYRRRSIDFDQSEPLGPLGVELVGDGAGARFDGSHGGGPDRIDDEEYG